jgi:prolyl oligopeptidase
MRGQIPEIRRAARWRRIVMHIRRTVAVAVPVALALVVLELTGNHLVFAKKYQYPEAKKGDVVDDYFGTKVADPYRWLEDADAQDTREWVARENALTRRYIDSYPRREAIESRMTKLWNYARYSLPARHGDR